MRSITPSDLEKLRQAHNEGRFAEFKRGKRFGSGITGYVTEYSPEVFVIEELNWDCFRLGGVAILPVKTVAGLRIFAADDWKIRAAKELGVTKRVSFQLTKKPFSSIVKEVMSDSRLMEIESSQSEPDELLLVECLQLTKLKMRVKSYDANLKPACEFDIRFSEITKLTVRDGYCHAAEIGLKVPRQKQPTAAQA
jgi:hypothetical protein